MPPQPLQAGSRTRESRFLDNPFFHALTSSHAHFALENRPAIRYRPDVIPFGAVAEPTPDAMLALRDLLAPGESIFTTGDGFPEVRGLQPTLALPGLQMLHVGAVPPNVPLSFRLQPLTSADVAEMLALKAVAFPGYFGPRAIELGSFFGVRVEGQLVAMAGERLSTREVSEVSAVCTHPAHTGRGYARALIGAVLRAQAERGVQSLLHVVSSNHRAIALYQQLGFVTTGEIVFQQFRRV